MHTPSDRLRRRSLLALATMSLVTASSARSGPVRPPTGWVEPPEAMPPLQVTDTAGRQLSLANAMAGKVTAVQLMFTGCSSVCPVQGALFAEMARRMRGADVRWLSVSIDALGDTPGALAAWQDRFGRSPAWKALVPAAAEVTRLTDFIEGTAIKHGTHTAQVFVFDREARLVYRTADSPSVDDLEALLTHFVRRG